MKKIGMETLWTFFEGITLSADERKYSFDQLNISCFCKCQGVLK